MLSDNFASNLKALMWYRNENQGQLAKIIGVTKQAVSRWCIGKTKPSKITADKIAKHYGITTEDLMYGNPFKDIEIDTLKYIRDIFVKFGVIPPNKEMTDEDYKNAMAFLRNNSNLIFKDK